MTDGPHAEGSTQPTSGQAAELTQSALSRAVVSPHDQIREMMNAAKEGAPIFGDPRRPFALTDTFLATLSRHFAAVEDVVYPEVHRRLDNGMAIGIGHVVATRQRSIFASVSSIRREPLTSEGVPR